MYKKYNSTLSTLYYSKAKNMGTCCSQPIDKNRNNNKDKYPHDSLVKADSGHTASNNTKGSVDQPQIQKKLMKLIWQNRTLNQDIDSNQKMTTLTLSGSEQELQKILEVVVRYRYCFLLYLLPVQEIILKQAVQGKIELIVPQYQLNLVNLGERQLKNHEKYLLMMRITRAARFLSDKQINLNRLQAKKIYLQEDKIGLIPKIGLPEFSELRKIFREGKRLTQQELIELNKKLCLIFLTIIVGKEIKSGSASQQIKKISDEKLKQLLTDLRNDKNPLSLMNLSNRIFTLNYQDPMKELPQDKKVLIEYESGQKYEGEVIESNVKHGYGKEIDNQGNYYVGEWKNNQRQGYGAYVMLKEQYIYIGEWKSNVIHGKGFEININKIVCYQGNYINGKKQGLGLLEGIKGEIYYGEWKNDLKEGKGTYFDGDNEWAYKGEWINDLKNGQAEQLYSNGAYFKGNLVRGVKQGYGQYNIPHKFSYKGDFVDNKFQGQGEYIDYKEKSTYKGNYYQNLYHGKGSYSRPDYSYDGQWTKGTKEGKGIEIIGTTAKYEGQFKNDVRHGKGVLDEQGQIFQGTFQHGSYSGDGVYTYQNGDRYEGKFKNKQKDGFGVYKSAQDGSVYEGQWKNDKRHGKGKYIFKSGGYYEGNWVDGMRQGQGKEHLSENNHYEGFWKNDKKEGHGKQVEPNGNKYQGQFKQNMKHGKGKLLYSNGDIYEGEFKDNLHDGQGTYYFKNKDKYEGQWIKGNREGKGTLTKANGEYYQGEWKNNRKNGKGKEVYKNKLEYFQGEFKDDLKEGAGVLYNKKYGRLECTWINNKRQGVGNFYFNDGTIEARQYRNNAEINLHSSNLRNSQPGN